jgi:hypothetical protein
MAYTPDFDLDDVVGILNSVSENHAEDSKERAAIELAQAALLYTRHIRKGKDFARYYKDLHDPSYKRKIAQEFATREEADQWIASGKAQEADLVKIAGKGFQVARLPGRKVFIDAPLPEELEGDEWKMDSE